MICSFKVKDGKITDIKYTEGNFNCSHNQLTSLKGCPEKIGGEFDCSQNQLTSLEGCPKKVEGVFRCSRNKLTSLKGCPEKIEGYFNCSNNSLLTDISDLPSNCQIVDIKNCPKITKFPNQINDTLIFLHPTGWVRRRIKKHPFYEVTDERNYYKSITVRLKRIGLGLLDSL